MAKASPLFDARTPAAHAIPQRIADVGHDVGRIVFEGTPADLVAARSTLTGERRSAFVGCRPSAAASR